MTFGRSDVRGKVAGGWPVVVLAALLCCAGAGRAQTVDSYTVAVEGIENLDLKKSVLDISQLEEGKSRPVPTVRALQRRVDAGVERVDKLLRAQGFYDARIETAIEPVDTTGRRIVLRIDTGPAYKLARYDIVPATPGEPRTAIDIPYTTLGMTPGDIALAEKIAEADGKLLAAFAQRAYPLAKITERKVTVDHATKSVSVVVTVETGPYARFGPVSAEGLRNVDSSLIARHILWQRGAPFDSTELEKTRKALRETGLFSAVTVRQGDATDAQGELPIVVKVTERGHRSIGAGGSFSTTEGLLGRVFWEHRNLFDHGERLRIRGEVGEIRQGAFGDFRISDFGTLGQDLVIDARATREQPDGYTSVETGAIARLERRFGEIYAGSAGVGFDRSSVDTNEADRNFTFLVLPLSLRRDNADDLLDPSRGGRDVLTFTPNIGILSTDTNFFSTQLFDSVYLPILPEKELVLAGWARIGTIFGATTNAIPANKRRYAGGPGSVRGYALNNIGPLDSENEPVGGRSSTEFGIELRWRVTGPFGLAAFAEAGAVYDDLIPDWGNDLQWGAGVGGRYLTDFGPIRVDFAVPLNRRNEVDDAFQILISLGQAF